MVQKYITYRLSIKARNAASSTATRPTTRTCAKLSWAGVKTVAAGLRNDGTAAEGGWMWLPRRMVFAVVQKFAARETTTSDRG